MGLRKNGLRDGMLLAWKIRRGPIEPGKIKETFSPSVSQKGAQPTNTLILVPCGTCVEL